jgi:glycosyltransferase involved in cell wall biosynthesis
MGFRRLRVAIVARSVHPLHGVGGLERSVYDLARFLARSDVEVTLITAPPRDGRSADEIHPGLRAVYVPYRTFPLAGRRGTTVIDRSTAYPIFGLRAGRAALDLVRSGSVDIVHGFGASVLGYARRRHEHAVPLVLNPQGLEEFGATDPSRARLKRAAYLPLRKAVLACAGAADRIIATDRALQPAVENHLRVPADRVCVIPNGVDLESLDSLARPEDGARVRANAGIAPDEALILSVGRIEKNKGFHILVDALAAIRLHGGPAAVQKWRWVLLGDGPYRHAVERQIDQAGIRERAILAGRVDDKTLHSWYEAAALFVHPTLYEGSSLVTLEVMAHRKAVVATRAGGLPDKVKPGINGWLVEPGKADALAAVLSGALGNLSQLPPMGAAGRAIVEAEFDWPILARKHLELYGGLLA